VRIRKDFDTQKVEIKEKSAAAKKHLAAMHQLRTEIDVYAWIKEFAATVLVYCGLFVCVSVSSWLE
jgi:hypothetical protein